jgi:hypothetical protein
MYCTVLHVTTSDNTVVVLSVLFCIQIVFFIILEPSRNKYNMYLTTTGIHYVDKYKDVNTSNGNVSDAVKNTEC